MGSGIKVWANGDILTASDVNGYLMQQSVITCTSGSRPASPVNGMTIYQTDLRAFAVYDSAGAAWRRAGAFDTESLGHAGANETTTIASITSSTPAAGSPVCGASFTSPPSGGVYITVSGRINQSANGNETNLGFILRSGSSVGTGTVQVDFSSFRALSCGRAVVTSGSSMTAGSRRYRVNPGTLTPNTAFNVVTVHWVTGGTGQVDYREIAVEPVF